MEVILLEKIRGLGELGDKVVVKPGYGRNYLVPQRKAALANAENLATFEARRAELEQAQREALEHAKTRAAKLKEMVVVVTSKVGLEGKLFGSVSNFDIAEALTQAGVDVKKSEIRLPDGPIRLTGEYEIAIHLHSDVDASVTVQVVAEEDE